ncbi:MAG: hypothetical protein GF390_02095 [Candidatus Pacebacteria bacterium]|nr:hypothetical protein [Candidatus Paceibacterota bacterium]
MKIKLIISTSLCLIMLAQSTSLVLADRLESDSYVIQFGNFNMGSGERDSAGSTYHLTYTLGQTAPGPFGEYGSTSYFVGSGFQYIYQIDEFSFTISDITIDLGTLTPGSHSTDSNQLTINTRGAGGFTIYAYELHPLRLISGADEIPNTSCDGGGCTISNAEVWTNTSIPGFGFNVDGTDKASDFTDTTYFRPFADEEQSEAMQAIMNSSALAINSQATVTYKAGVDENQMAGDYETSIVFVAVPGY